MQYKVEELVDTIIIKELLLDFHSLTGITTALLRPDGEIIKATDGSALISGWQSICLNFHRKNEQTAKRCLESDTVLANLSLINKQPTFYQCKNGMNDVAIPIIVDEQHIANLFTGQFFLEPPDKDFFREQAHRFHFDEKEYLSALEMVPIFTQEKINSGVQFLLRMAKMIAEIAIKNLQLKQRVKKLEGLIPICAKCKKIRDDKGLWEQLEEYIENHSDIMFSHGLCPECSDDLYGSEEWYKKN